MKKGMLNGWLMDKMDRWIGGARGWMDGFICITPNLMRPVRGWKVLDLEIKKKSRTVKLSERRMKQKGNGVEVGKMSSTEETKGVHEKN